MAQYKLFFSTFFSRQLVRVTGEDKVDVNAKLTDLRRGVFGAHHKSIQGDKGKKVLRDKVGLTEAKAPAIEEVAVLGSYWRLFFYRTGWYPKNELELERKKAVEAGRIDHDNRLDGTLWMILIGHLDGSNVLELFVSGAKNATPSLVATNKGLGHHQRRDVPEPTGEIYKDVLSKLREMNAQED